jgi:hypothetical protein
MKKLLLLISVIILSQPLFSQTNNWYQYTVLRKVNHIVKDAVNNLHIGTDIGYMKYNTTTNSVEKVYNITTQNPPIGEVRFVAVNPTNNNLSMVLSQGIAVSNGTSITKYISSSSDLHKFITPNLYYAKDGTLYIYEGVDFAESTKYQTFSNGIFSAVKTMTFSISSIVENNNGTKIFFASDNSGLFEFVKATSAFTNFTVSNSDLVNDSVNTLLMDANNKLHIGCSQGLNILTDAGVWATFQEQIPNSSSFYSVFSIDQNTTGELLLNNSKGTNVKKGYSILNPTTSVWTHHDPSTYCSTNADNLNKILFVGDVLFANFSSSTEEPRKLWSFSPGSNACTEHNLNYLGIELYDQGFSSATMSTVTLKENKNDNSMLDVGFSYLVGSEANKFKNITIPIKFTGSFPQPTTIFNGANFSPPRTSINTVTSLNDTFIIAGEKGFEFTDDSVPDTFIPHNIPNFKITKIQKIATRNTTGTGTVDNKMTLIIEGLDNNNRTHVYKTECDVLNRTFDAFEELFTNRDLNEPFHYTCSADYIEGKVACVGFGKLNNVVQFWGEGWDELTNGPPTEEFKDDVTALNPFINNDIHFWDIYYGVPIREKEYKPRPCFRGNTGQTNSYTYKCRKGDGTYASTTFYPKDQDEGDEIIEDNLEHYIGGYEVGNLFSLMLVGFNHKKASESVNAYFAKEEGNSGGKSKSTISYTILSGVALKVPSDFNMYNNPVVILPHSKTHFAMVVNSNYGLLIKTAIDYSSLTLDVKDEAFNNVASKLYPNPTSGTVTIARSDVKNITVFDMKGNKVMRATTAEFSVKSLATGIYMVRIISKDNRIISKKLIKN